MNFPKSLKKKVYLDYAAATPMDKRVVRAMKKYWNKEFGNPNAIHQEGVKVKKALEKARGDIASLLSTHADEIIFTSGGTESNNLAIKGLIEHLKEEVKNPHIITSSIEHPSILEVCQNLEKEGVEVTYLKPDKEGLINPKDIKEALRENTVLVSIMYANNEIGSIQPIKEISKIIRHFKKQYQKDNTDYPFFHTDACQAVGYLDIDVLRLNIDMMSVSGAKIYGPKGVGFLYKKRNVALSPIIIGGGQEKGLRSGTENIPSIIGLAEALKIVKEVKEKENQRVQSLRDYFIDSLLSNYNFTSLNGSKKERLPNNVNVSFSDIDNERLIIELDAKGIFASAKSACQSHQSDASYVIMALGKDKKEANSSVRFSLGRQTTLRDINYVLKTLLKIINKIN